MCLNTCDSGYSNSAHINKQREAPSHTGEKMDDQLDRIGAEERT